MTEEATHQLARQAVAKLCQPLGWQGMGNGACDVLADLMKRYVLMLGRHTAAYASHANRTEPALEDVACVFQDVGVTLAELSTYTRLVESSSLTPLPHFPLTRHSAHVYSRPSTPVTRPRPSLSLSEEDDEEEDVIPAHFPPLPSKKAEVDKDDVESGVHDAADQDELMDVSNSLITPADPNKGLPQLYRSRSRLSSEFSEEGEGGSRRGSFSDASVLSRGTPTEVAAMSRIAQLMSESGQNRPVTPVEDDVITKPQTPIPIPQNGTQTMQSSVASIGRVQVSLTRIASVPSLQTWSVPHATDRRMSEPSVQLVTQSAPLAPPTPTRPSLPASHPTLPPLRLMSAGEALPLASPILVSPSSTLYSVAGATRPSLPLLSPLRTTPTIPLPTLTRPQLSSPAADATLPQIMPTTTTPAKPHLPLLPPPPLVSPINVHPQFPGTTLPINTDATPRLLYPPSPIDTDPQLENENTPPSPIQSQAHERESQSQQELTVEAKPRPLSLLPQEPLGGSEELKRRPLHQTESTARSREDDVRERLSDENSSPSPPTALYKEVTPKELFVTERESEEKQLSPEIPLVASRPTSSASLHVEKSRDIDPARDEDNDSILSSISSKPLSPLIFPGPTIPAEPEDDEGEEAVEETASTGFNEEAEEQEGRGVGGEESEDVRVIEGEEGIDVEDAGEGGVESILHGEEEMELPDIEKQLEMSDSEEESDSSSGSEVEVEALTDKLRLGDPRGDEELPGLHRSSEGLFPARVPSVRSSSHSLASTPSISPSPSPIPHASPLPSPHSIPISSPGFIPPLDPPPPPPSTREEVKLKPSFSATPVTAFGAPEQKSQTGSLVVSFKKHLIASFSRGKEAGSKRTRPKSQPFLPPPAPISIKPHKDQIAKLKKRQVAVSSLLPPVNVPPPQSLMVSIPRNLLHRKSFGFSPVHESSFTFDPEDDGDNDDIIVTHSSADGVKFEPATERVKLEAGTKRVKLGMGSSVERVTKPAFSRHTLPLNPVEEQPSFLPEKEVVGGAGGGVWKRELDISEMGLLAPPPKRSKDQQQVVKIIPQPSSSSSSSDDSDSESESESSSRSSPSPPPMLPPAVHSPSPSPWQRPIRSEDEESTSSSATGGGGGLKLKLKISKALLLNVQLAIPKVEKRMRKRVSARAPPSGAPSQPHAGHSKRGRPSKGSARSSRKSGSNIPPLTLPRLELPLLPGSLPRRQSTPISEGHGAFPVKLPPAIAVSTGGEVWYCPQCSKPDDGSPMIGCDGTCEGWYHWNCIGIVQAPPENEKWFCPTCVSSRKGKRGRKRRT